MIHLTADRPHINQGETPSMKKLLVFAIGLGIVLGTVSFAQDTTDTTKKMSKKKKKSGSDTTSTTKNHNN
jgi:hypothetical protein